MNKEQAIDLLDNLIGMIEDNQDNDYDTAFRMAIEALKAQLSQEGTTSDTISRQAAIDALDCINGVEEVLRSLPSVQSERTEKRTEMHACDLISRQQALDTMCAVNDEYKSNPHIDAIIDALEDLPTAQPEPKWIPVSEGLPKKDGRYQVTRHDYVTNTEFIDILWYEKNTWWDRQATGDYAVTAWMPLPEPYKPNK